MRAELIKDLADNIEGIDTLTEWQRAKIRIAANELRRLAAELEEQKQATKTWENETERRSDRDTKCAAELEALKKAISEAEPEAWLYTELRTTGSHSTPYRQREVSTNPFFSRMDSAQPLYTLKGIK